MWSCVGGVVVWLLWSIRLEVSYAVESEAPSQSIDAEDLAHKRRESINVEAVDGVQQIDEVARRFR